MVEATGFEPAASASRTQRSTKLSHASISIYFSPQNHDCIRNGGFLCGRSGIYRYFSNTVPPIKCQFVRGSCGSAVFRAIIRYMLPNAAYSYGARNFFTTWSVEKFRPRRLFGLPLSATGSDRPQSYQTEPHLEISSRIVLAIFATY